MFKKFYSQKHNRPKTDKKSVIFGSHSVIEIIKSGKTIDKVFLNKNSNNSVHNELIKLLDEQKIPYSKVPIEKLNRITEKNHQGVIAFLSAVDFVLLENVIESTYEKGIVPLILVLDSITDVRNFGAIVRTAVCAGVNAIVVPAKNSVAIGGDALKTSSGALAHMNICRVDNIKRAIVYLKNSGLRILACTEKAEESVFEVDLAIPIALLFGSEGDGIMPDNLTIADQSIKIPMFGKIESLNVSVAAAVILYESIRQREKLGIK